MSFDLIAKSTDDARPVELYQISYTGNNWFYTSADRPILHNGVVYAPAVAKRSDLEMTTDVFQNANTLEFAGTTPFLEIFRVTPPSEVVTLTMLATNYLVDNEFIVFWKGRIINVEWDETSGMAKLTTESIFTSLQQQGLRRRYSRTCTYALYGPGCKVSRQQHREVTTVTQIAGIRVSVQAGVGKPYNFYAGGYITWVNSARGNTEKRMIRESFDTGQLLLAGQVINLQGGAAVEIYPGCDHLIATCADKFDNEENYGGTPFIPGTNPFTGTSLF